MGAQRHVSLAALYLGTGQRPRQFVAALEQRAREVPGLTVRVVLDHSRGNRPAGGGRSSASVLRALAATDAGADLDASGGGAHAARHTRRRGSGAARIVTKATSAVTEALRFIGDTDDRHEAANSGGDVDDERIRIAFFRMPQLDGWLRARWPARYKEGAATQHLKAYVFDDTLVMSGANLSEDYFTDRQDRYVVFRNAAPLAAFFHNLIDALSLHSSVLPPAAAARVGRQLEVAAAAAVATRADASSDDDSAAPLAQGAGAVDEANAVARVLEPASRLRASLPMGMLSLADNYAGLRASLEPFLSPSFPGSVDPRAAPPATRTLVRPLMQFAPLGIVADEEATCAVLAEASPHDRLHIACGYFNFPQRYIDVLLRLQSREEVPVPPPHTDVLTASPEANGFFGSAGISGALPVAYSVFVKKFVEQAQRVGFGDRLTVIEYTRPDWTFHAKGMWLSPGAARAAVEPTDADVNDDGGPAKSEVPASAAHGAPCVTLVGSPNLGRRSVSSDLECQLLVTTGDAALRARLAGERDTLFSADTGRVADLEVLNGPDRRLHGWSWRQGLWIHIGHRVASPLL